MDFARKIHFGVCFADDGSTNESSNGGGCRTKGDRGLQQTVRGAAFEDGYAGDIGTVGGGWC